MVPQGRWLWQYRLLMEELSKALKKEIRSLMGLGYERSLNAELIKLNRHFDAWKAQQMDPFELTEQIHVFHNGPARDLYNRFGMRGLEELTIAALVVDGLLKEAEISADLWDRVYPIAEQLRTNRGDSDADPLYM
jgi:hypothetical protein